jgi:hypothetical protein
LVLEILLGAKNGLGSPEFQKKGGSHERKLVIPWRGEKVTKDAYLYRGQETKREIPNE